MPINTPGFVEAVNAEIKTNAIKTLKSHPTRLVENALYSVGRIFVSKDPDEDTVAEKLDAAATLLENAAAAIRDEDNPLDISYPMSDGMYTGEEATFKIHTDYAEETMIPTSIVERSAHNRVCAAAKKAVK